MSVHASRPTPTPGTVDWASVNSILRKRRTGPSRPAARVESLAAMAARDFRGAVEAISAARDADPFDPLHSLRMVLLALRFGRIDEAAGLAQSLADSWTDDPLPIYLRGLATLRQEEFRRAGNVASELVQKSPALVQAKFLHAEAQLGYQFKGFSKILAGLPRNSACEGLWADLLIKMLLTGPEDAVKAASQAIEQGVALPRGSRARALVEEAVSLKGAEFEALEKALAERTAGSRGEQIVLSLMTDRLRAEPELSSALGRIRKLHETHPERGAIRRVFAALLTQQAIEDARHERYHDAARLIERCVSLEPHETIHHQNLAVLFTLLREHDAYHDAWLALNRHHYRLALLGRLGPAEAAEIAMSHRMFAQQARFVPEAAGSRFRRNLGIFIEERGADPSQGGREPLIVANHDRIGGDPDLLRQWIHHRRAEFVFAHVALGANPSRFLIDPGEPGLARERLVGLTILAKSLPVLVPEEGKLLAERLSAAWGQAASRLAPRYRDEPDDPAVGRLRIAHVETFADLALLCLTWRPDGSRADLVEEVLEFLRAGAPFFDDRVLAAMLRETDREPHRIYALRLLAGFLSDALGLQGDVLRLDDATRRRAAEALASRLLLHTSFRVYESARGARAAVERSLAYLDRAREADPENPRVEVAAARMLLLGDYLSESRASLGRFHRLSGSRDPELLGEAEEIRLLLEEKRRQGLKGGRREGRGIEEHPEIDASEDRGIAALERAVEHDPGSVSAYEDLARALARDGRFDEALAWSERAVSRCLARQNQLSARALNLEILGLQELARRHREVVSTYLSGPPDTAVESIAGSTDADAPYALHYLLGNAAIAARRPKEARAAYERALSSCDRQIHRTLLRNLASDIDAVYLAAARRSIQDEIQAGRLESALNEAAEMLGQLVRPEVALIDLASIHLSAASRLAIGPTASLPIPAYRVDAAWIDRLHAAFRRSSDLDRARELAALAMSLDESSRKSGEAILRKADALAEQARLVAILAESGRLLRDGDFTGALKALDEVGPSVDSEPRVLRQRALLLLKLDRFDEADEIAETLGQSIAPVAREFAEAYPALSFRQRLAAGNRLLREGRDEEAARILEPARPPDAAATIELAYSRAFGLAMKAHRLRRAGNRAEWVETLDRAMSQVEPHIPSARSTGHARMLELYEMLDRDLEGPEAAKVKGGPRS